MIIRRNSSVSPALALVALALSSRPTPAQGCSSFEPTLFVAPYVPDTPPGRFAAGELGVLQPTWIRAYLVVAYRHLSGAPLSQAEQAGAVAYFEGPKPSADGLESWKRARDVVAGSAGPSIETERSAGYATYVNCGDDAFLRAASTLEGYVKDRGPASAETRSWVEAQDAVFSNCGGTTPKVPDPLPAGAPAALRADRAYQVAAARFYAGRLEDAQKSFEEISSDAGSRWRHLGAYLAARSIVRRATLSTEDPREFRALLEEARKRFLSVSRDSRDPGLRRASGDLVRFADLRIDPAARVPEAAARVLAPHPGDDFSSTVVHYRDLLYRVLGLGPEPGNYVPDPTDDLTSWIVAFQDPGPRGLERALAGFSRNPTLPWIAAVLSKIPSSHPRSAEVVEAARRLPPKAAGRIHVAYHLARLATEGGRTAEARALVDGRLEAARAAGVSAENLFLELKVRNASTFAEFTEAAPRRVVGDEKAGNFDEYTRDILNRRIPLEALVRFAQSLSRESRAGVDLLRVARTRAILLGRADVARALAPPGAKVNWEAVDWRVDAALAILVEDSESRPYVALDPSFQIAWWCALPAPLGAGRGPAFLSDAERKAASEEVVRLEAVAPAASWFTREALAFARENPKDPRSPEFLARAVRATREGCADGETRSLSKAAFEMLHREYPRSPQARETKYWFEGRGWYPPPPPKPAPPPPA